MKIFIVTGETGEYSDHTGWFDGAYLSEEKAKNRVLELEGYLKTFGEHQSLNYKERKEVETKMREFDEQFELDYTGTRYFYFEVEVKDAS